MPAALDDIKLPNSVANAIKSDPITKRGSSPQIEATEMVMEENQELASPVMI